MIKQRFLVLAIALIAVCGASQAFSQEQTKDVVFGPFKAYNHRSGWFTMDLPTNWSIKDASKNNEVILSISDPSVNAALSVHVWEQSTPLEGGPAKYLKDYLNQTLSSFKNFSQGEPKIQKDGSTGIYFKWDEPISSGTVRMWGDAFIEQRGGLVGMVVFLIPEEQYQKKKDQAYRLVNSFGLTP